MNRFPFHRTNGAVAVFSLAFSILSPAQEDLSLIAGVPNGLTYQLQLQGPVERNVSVHTSGDLSTWSVPGNATEFLPGLYQHVDDTTPGVTRRFYQAQDDGPVVLGAWADTYAIEPANHGLVSALPTFSWAPYPGPPPIDYQFSVYEFERAANGRLILPSAPILSVGGLIDPSYTWDPADPDLNPNHLYAYNVTANVFGLQDFGTTVFFVPFGGDGHIQPTDWGKLMEVIKVMLDELGTLESELAGNPLIQEIQLIEKLIEILNNYDKFKTYLTAILNSEFQKLIDSSLTVDNVIKILCFLEDAAKVLALDPDLPANKKAALDAFKDGIGDVKEALENGQSLADAWTDVEQLVADLVSFISDPVQFILDAAKDKFVEKIEEILVRKLGEAAAGSLISIAINLAIFADALATVINIDILIAEINGLLLNGISNSRSSDVFNPNGAYVFPLPPSQENCTITVAFKKICFSPSTKPGAGPNEGTWTGPTTVRYADGSSSKSMRAGDLPTVFPNGPTKPPHRVFNDPKDPADVSCSDGPCIVFMEITVSCDGKASRTHRIFAGVVKKCP